MAINLSPQAFNDEYSVAEDQVLKVSVGIGVLANDDDPNHDKLAAYLVSTTDNLLFKFQTNGSFVFDARNYDFLSAGEQLTDSFEYQVSDGRLLSDPATVTVTITGVNDAPVVLNDVATTSSGNSVSINILANDTDVDLDDTLSIAALADVKDGAGPAGTADSTPQDGLSIVTDAGGTVELVSGWLSYEAAPGFFGVDTFRYTVDDGHGGSASAIVSVTVNPTNAAPVARNDEYQVNEDGTLAVAAPGVLQNDSDADGDALGATLLTDPAKGLLGFWADGSFNYDPNGQFEYLGVGEEEKVSFTYTAFDGSNLSSSATVEIAVQGENDLPVAAGDTNWAYEDQASAQGNVLLSLAHGGAPTGTFSDVADTDVDFNDKLTVNQVNASAVSGGTTAADGTVVQGSYGALTIGADGSYSYAVDNASAAVQGLKDGESVTDAFTYTVSDGTTTASASLTITVFGTNDAPVAKADTNWAREDASDAQGNVLQTLAHGGAPAGVFGDVADTHDDVGPLTLTAVGASAVAGGTNAANGTSQAGTYGTLSIGADGSYSYTLDNTKSAVQALDDGESATDAFTYTVSDGTDTASASLTITIFGTNDAPIAKADTNWAKEDTNNALGNVLQTLAHSGAPSGVFGDVADTDADIEALTVTAIGASAVAAGTSAADGQVVSGAYGTLTIGADGSYSYALDNTKTEVQGLDDGESLADSFTYTVSDGTATASAALSITVFGTNDAPIAKADTNWAREDTSNASGNVLQTLAHGGAPAGVFGDVADTDADIETLTVTAIDAIAVAAGTTAANGTTRAGSYGTLGIGADGSYTYTLDNTKAAVQALDDGESLTESFTYSVSDGTATASASVTVTVFGANDTPIAKADTNWAKLNAANAGGNVLTNLAHGGAPSGTYADVADTDVDVESLAITQIGALPVAAGTTSLNGTQLVGAHGTLTIGADGSYGYIVNAADPIFLTLGTGSVTDTFTYSASDGTATASASLTITVFGNPSPPSLADRFFINEISVAGPSHASSSAIELINNYNNAVSSGDLAQANVQIVNPAGVMTTLNLSKLVGLTVDASGNPIGGSALPGNSLLVLYEPSTAYPNGYWRVLSGNSEKNGVFGADMRSYWSLGSTVADKLAVNLTQSGSSLDLFIANGVSIASLTGVGTLGYGYHSLGSTSKVGFQTPERSAAWYAGAELLADQSGLPADVVAQIGANNIQFNGALGSGTDTVFARVYDRYLVSNKGSSVDDQFIDNNDAGDWTFGSSVMRTLGVKNAVYLPSGKLSTAVANSQDSTDNINPNQGTGVHADVVAQISNEDGQTVVAAANTGGTVNGGAGPDYLYGGTGADSIVGGANDDFLWGSGGNDTLNGGTGADRLIGGAGADTLTGGSGPDQFWFNAALIAGNADAIADFVSGVDRIVLDRSLFTGLAAGALAAGDFVAGASPVAGDVSDRILYNTATGALFYDADGNTAGGVAAIQIATLTGNPTLLATDFLIV